MARSKSPIKARLEDWQLRRVPFPTTPYVDPFNKDSLRNGSVFAPELREVEIEKIRHVILKHGYASMVKPWSWMWAKKKVGGSLGMGKTALLAYVTDQINQDYGKRFFGSAAHWLAVYVPVLPSIKSVQELAGVALASVCSEARGTGVERLLLGRLRRKVILLSPQNEYSTVVRNTSDSHFMDDKWLSEHGVDLSILSAAVQKHLREWKVSSAFSQALAGGTLSDYLSTVNGDTNLVPPRSSLSNKALSFLLNDLARAACAAEIKQITFFLDDFYYLVRRTPPKDRPELAANLRTFAVTGSVSYVAVKENVFSWVAVMHTHTASGFNVAWEGVDLHKIAPLKLDAESSVVLNQFPAAKGRDLLTAYLMFQRPGRPPYDTYPFTPEALDKIANITASEIRGAEDVVEPRGLLLNAYEVTSRALLIQQVEVPIGPDFVAHVLQGAPLPVTPAEDEANDPDSERDMGASAVCPCNCHTDEAPQQFYDVRERIAGGTNTVVGYYCAACSMPIDIKLNVSA